MDENNNSPPSPGTLSVLGLEAIPQLREISLGEEELLQLVWRMKDPKSGLVIKDRKKSLKTYKASFVGQELIDWLIEKGIATTRDEGLAIAENLLAKNIIISANNRDTVSFLDELTAFYSFSEFRHLPRDNSEISLSELDITPEPEKPSKEESTYRICLLGNERSGKTTFCHTLVKGSFADDVKSNNEEVFTKEKVKLSDSETVTIQLMDTGNILETNFEEKLTKWNEWAHGFMLVYSINSKSSFEHIPKLFNTLIKVRNFKMTPITLVATKADCEDERKVSKEEALNLSARYRCPIIEVSSKTGQGLNESIDAMVQSIKKIQFISGPVQHKSGWIKLRVGTQGLKKRFVFLTDSGLRYYSQEPESLSDTTNLKGIIPMQNCVIEILELPSDSKGGNRRASDPSLLRSTLVASGRRQSQGSDPSESPERERSSSGSLPGSPLNKTLTRKNSLSAMSKSAKLKIFITDYNEKSYEILTETEQEKEKWFQSLCKVIEKANTERQNRSLSDVDQHAEKEPLTDEEILAEGIKRFNKSPKKGIQYLVDRNKLEKTESSVVKFLVANAKTLRKSAIGEYLGDGDPFCVSVLVEYLEGFNFEKVSFDEAMRLFLSKFTIPGEAQKIDRIMEKFASRFCKCNPSAFETPDVGYILAFSLIMLNTDAHNPNIKPENKMNKEQFVTNNRGINNGKDLPREYLEALYDKIVQNEIKMEHERDDFTQWDKQGFLYVRDVKDKRGTIHVGALNKKNVGKKLFCIISSCVLYLFESPTDKKPLNIVPLKNLQIDSLFEDAKDSKDSTFTGFTLYCNDPNGFIKSAVEGKEVLLKELQFFCEDRKTKMEWMLTFKLNLVSSPY
mmetsp:Transcript_13530/g.18710  ORF Transcript_13530/g.18710 Transcript_13530/m.18710 type:complete len:849 (-) Transcript_13530:52-2598(-)